MSRLEDLMPRLVKASNSKAERRSERKKIGKLQNQVVLPVTVDRYEAIFQQFLSHSGFAKGYFQEHVQEIDVHLSEFVEFLWKDGEPKSYANYAAASVQFFIPESKRKLVNAWRLISTWNKIEIPVRATPISPEILLGFSGLFQQWKYTRVAQMLLVGYSAFLRTGEMFRVRVEDVVLPRGSHQAAVIFLQDTKTSQRHQKQMQWEKVLIKEQLALEALRQLCRQRGRKEFLMDVTVHQFRKLWAEAVSYFQLQNQKIQPYSIRRGGATSAYRLGTTFEELMQQGRWANVATARIYLDEAIQELNTLSLSSTSRRLLRQASRPFVRCKPERDAWRGGARQPWERVLFFHFGHLNLRSQIGGMEWLRQFDKGHGLWLVEKEALLCPWSSCG